MKPRALPAVWVPITFFLVFVSTGPLLSQEKTLSLDMFPEMESVSNLQISPDGTRIAFSASGESSGSQIFVRWMDAEGATTQVTRVESSPSDFMRSQFYIQSFFEKWSR